MLSQTAMSVPGGTFTWTSTLIAAPATDLFRYHPSAPPATTFCLWAMSLGWRNVVAMVLPKMRLATEALIVLLTRYRVGLTLAVAQMEAFMASICASAAPERLRAEPSRDRKSTRLNSSHLGI